ncbi:MAG TPA: prepilin-type N-terminal cleavage/methylation domain-containing protein [Thermoanaerobaculia bacterium]|nr:prepilin-type N-terminal cleavage/methylation domain-containing protein [Thermoanaerobaculia bacterium]
MRNARLRGNSGYSLVEVLIAMAILGTVIMSIMTLFVFGRRNVYSGRQMTRAVSVTTHVVEDIVPLAPAAFYTTFKITTTTTLGNNTVADVTYPNSVVRRLPDFAVADPGHRYFDNWMQLLPQSRITGGNVALVIMPRDLAITNDPTSARRLLIKAVTEWNEGARSRQVSLDVTKLNRKF